MAELSPWEIVGYDTRRDALRNQYQSALAQFTYDRSMLGAQELIDFDDLGWQWNQRRDRLPGAFNRRGLLNSGIYNQGLQDYGHERQSAYDKLRFNYEKTRGQISIDEQKALGGYNTGMATVDAEQSARRQQLASQLREIA